MLGSYRNKNKIWWKPFTFNKWRSFWNWKKRKENDFFFKYPVWYIWYYLWFARYIGIF